MMEDLQLIRPGEVRVRIAPSPTGPFHIGLARTALFNWLFAEKNQGVFILRIEDTDKARSEKKYEEEIIEGLKWLGLDWQEGPDNGGQFGPYRQSERGELYKKYLQKLFDQGKIYRCFCSPEELEAHRQYLLSIGQPPRYSEKCRDLSPDEAEKLVKQGRLFVLRFKTPAKKIVFQDLLRGEITTDTENFGDMVAAKGFDEPLYNFCAAIDDIEMKITHIIRGEDHISNTPKQILFYEALGAGIPKFLHLPLILGTDRSKLSKRHGAQSLIGYKEQGYLPEAMVNFLAFLGWNPGDEREIFSPAGLVKEFSLEKLQKSGAVFNIQKLDWLNSFYLRQKSKEKFVELCLPYLIEAGLITPVFETEKYPPAYGGDAINQKFKDKETNEEIGLGKIAEIVGLYQERIKKLSEIAELVDYFFKKELNYQQELLRWKDMTGKEIKSSLESAKKVLNKIDEENWRKERIETALLALCEEPEQKGDRGRVLWPLRAALTGKSASASPFDITAILGKEKTLDRIKQAKDRIKQAKKIL